MELIFAKIEGKTRKNLVKVWDIRWSKLLKVMKWFALLTQFYSFSYVCGEKTGSIADIGQKILNTLIVIRKKIFDYISPENFFAPNFSRKNFYDLVKILGKVGQSMTTTPQC